MIANRGEVAVRVARGVREAGLSPVGVFAAGEAGAPYLACMDARVALPGAAAAAYLDAAALVAAAGELDADALHPGWGFLSESPLLAESCAAAGVVFVGPSAALLALFGDKRRTRELAARNGVPVAEAAGDVSGALRMLDAGPVLLKAASGGGGRGMRVVRDATELPAAWQAASAEAAAFFGDGALFAERLIEQARHIEVQIAGDGAAAVSLGTRDCTLQRRHQKMIETAPAQRVPELEQAALRMARDVGYRGLGTWEFLVGPEGFVFLEVNPRLQVEHTVTEAVTGLDLVQLQLRLAAGETIGGAGIGAATGGTRVCDAGADQCRGAVGGWLGAAKCGHGGFVAAAGRTRASRGSCAGRGCSGDGGIRFAAGETDCARAGSRKRSAPRGARTR